MRDLRRTAEIVFFTAILLLASGSFAPLWTDPGSHDVVKGGQALEVVWSAAYVIVIALAVNNRRELMAHAVHLKWIVLLVGLCCLSVFWSANAVVSARKAAAVAGTTLTGLIFAVRFDVRQQIRIVAGVITIAAIASVVASVAFSTAFPATESAPGAWNGVFSHKNLLGRAMCLGAAAFCTFGFQRLRDAYTSIVGSVGCISLIFTSQSRTALVVCVICVALVCVGPILRAEWRQAVGIVLLATLILSPLLAYALAHNREFTSILGRDTTLTGRSRIWDIAWLSWTQRPWLGYGYGGFWWVAPESREALALIGYPTPNSHNGFLELALQVGVAGLCIFLVGWLAAFRGALRYFRHIARADARWPLIYLIFLLLYSFTESSLLAPNSILWILYVAACATVRWPSGHSTTPNAF